MSKSTTSPNPWDAARKIKVLRCAPGYPLADLEPGVKFFVLMLERLGAQTLYSCEGHPRGFYVTVLLPVRNRPATERARVFRLRNKREWPVDNAPIRIAERSLAEAEIPIAPTGGRILGGRVWQIECARSRQKTADYLAATPTN